MNPDFTKSIRNLFNLVGLRPVRKSPFVRRRFSYRKPGRISKMLNSNSFTPVSLVPASECEKVEASTLYRIWADIPGAHKWMHYFSTYQSVVSHFDAQLIRMLDIGIYKGGSLRMWRDYLPAESVIVGRLFADIFSNQHYFLWANDHMLGSLLSTGEFRSG